MVSSAAAKLPKRCPKCGDSFDEVSAFCPKDGSPLETIAPDNPHVGTVVSGDIELLSVAGTGAMGTVYRARQRSIDRDVAVKVLHKELSNNASLAHRFHREAKIASKLQHPHVVDVHLVGELPDKSLYIVMEYLDGSSLAAALTDAGGKFPLSRALGITLQIADAVGGGHAIGIVHRDLKPENVMLVRRADVADWVKVLDFGIARIEVGEQTMETVAGRVMGTARYISPEGAIGAPVGPPGDVYAIATMLYEMLAGRTPFVANQPLGLLVKHAHEAPPPLETFVPDVPPAIARVIMDNLAKEPEKRAANGRAFAAALGAAARESSSPVAEAHVVARFSKSPATPITAKNDAKVANAAAFAATAPAFASASSSPGVVTSPGIVTSPAFDATLHSDGPPETSIRPAPSISYSAPEPDRKLGRNTWLVIAAAAFLLGIVGTVIVSRRGNGANEERAAYLEHCRVVLADGHYVEPPGENIEELVKAGLLKWPHDGELQQIRSEAEHEMITMAMAARASGDLVGARDLAEGAYRLDPTDNSARFTKAQAMDELSAISSGAALYTGTPRLVLESPPIAKTGTPVAMKCRIVLGAAGPKAKVTDVSITVLPNGETTGGAKVAVDASDPSNVTATLIAPAVGSWDVSFEASVDGTRVRAMRDLDVTE